MTKRMLIDAAHQEEVRVALTDGGKVEDFDFEYSTRKPLRGNIYLARITRVEPSLQAAFVEYGGNRHGFLAFNEIHPDYYQIPVSDREILQAAEDEESALAAELEFSDHDDDYGEDSGVEYDQDDADADRDDGGSDNGPSRDGFEAQPEDDFGDGPDGLDAYSDPDGSGGDDDDIDDNGKESGERRDDPAALAAPAAPEISTPATGEDEDPENAPAVRDEGDAEPDDQADAAPEDSGAQAGASGAAKDANDEKPAKANKQNRRQELLERYREARRKRARLIRNYKIQEVIKRRQVLLIQVVKEERGNKGAALTTYISLAGRYCVLMPNTARGGGISRKIPVASDRRKLKKIVEGLDVPQGMGLIIRTAGAKRTKAEIKRDYEYLLRLWENIRSLTLKSIAPCLVYEEASLIKRAIRDLYDKDISAVLVEGEAGYREAKDFMKMLMPSHAKNIQPYKDKTPLFLKYDVEKQLDAMFQPTVRLKSGGYLVIHQTEALIAIDVNSGKATRERNIELTALKTNIEAAHEAARQCRLRDLAGLIVIDFIDMEEPKNNRTVERKLKDALKNDRARLQAGRISNFGLLEMSRQRRRSGIIDGTTHVCPTCAGAGAVRSNEMAALRILRAIESEALSGKAGVITARTSLEIALYILNHKRDWLKRIEDDYGVSIEVASDETKAGDLYDIEKRGAPREIIDNRTIVRADQPEIIEDADAEVEDVGDAADDDIAAAAEREEERGTRKKRRRRKRRRDEPASAESAVAEGVVADKKDDIEAVEAGDAGQETAESATKDDDDETKPKRRRRRGRRGGRRNRRNGDAPEGGDAGEAPAAAGEEIAAASTDGDADPADPGNFQEAEGGDDGDRAAEPANEAITAIREDADLEPASVSFDPPEEVAAAPGDSAETDAAQADEPSASTTQTEAPDPSHEPESSRESGKSARKGWWQRAVGG